MALRTHRPQRQRDSFSARAEAEHSLRWYIRQSGRSRAGYWTIEVLLLLVSSSIPITTVFVTDNTRLAAVLGGVVVVFGGLRAIFHWHENWTRFTLACTAIIVELRLYDAHAKPYDTDATRDGLLMGKLNAIEKAESATWATLASPGSDNKAPQ